MPVERLVLFDVSGQLVGSGRVELGERHIGVREDVGTVERMDVVRKTGLSYDGIRTNVATWKIIHLDRGRFNVSNEQERSGGGSHENVRRVHPHDDIPCSSNFLGLKVVGNASGMICTGFNQIVQSDFISGIGLNSDSIELFSRTSSLESVSGFLLMGLLVVELKHDVLIYILRAVLYSVGEVS